MEILISRNGEQMGPYTLEEVNGYLTQGALVPTDQAWHEGLSEWISISQISGVVTQPSPIQSMEEPLRLGAKTIQTASSEMREFLELSCLYLAASDQQFTGVEQEWIDASFGHGTADRFLASLASTQWEEVFARINELAGLIPAHEMQIISGGIEDFLKELLSVDGWDSEEKERLDGFMKYLADMGMQVNQDTTDVPPILPQAIPQKPLKRETEETVEYDDDPLKVAINELSATLRGSLSTESVGSGFSLPFFGPSIPLKPIDKYAEIHTHYKEHDSHYGPYDFEKAASYDWEGKNPVIRFEGESKWHSIGVIKGVWDKCYASKKQTEKLKKAGVDFDDSAITFKQATWAIDKLNVAKKEVAAKKRAINAVKPATKNTLKKMDELGVKYKEGVTRAEADRLIEKHWEKIAKDEFKKNLKLAKERGLDVDSKIDPFDLSELIHEDAAPTPEQDKKLQDFNSTIATYGGRAQNFRNLTSDDAECHLDMIEEAVNWATTHSDINGDYDFENESGTHWYTQQRPLTSNEITALNEGCMKEVQKMIEEEESYCEEERDKILLKVAKAAFKKEKY
jgi:hypothetical protein